MNKPEIVLGIANGKPLPPQGLPKWVIRFAHELGKRLVEFNITIAHSPHPQQAHAVNSLIEGFRNMPGAIFFVWWDTRVEITPDQLETMIRAKKGVVGCLFTNDNPDPEWQCSFFPDMQAGEDGLLLVPEMEAGVKVFHRRVFDVIEKNDPKLAYIFDNSGRTNYAFAQERLFSFGEYERLLSPAKHLDYLCRHNGISILAHTGVMVKWRGHDGKLYPEKWPYMPWKFRRLPPPEDAADLPAAPADPRRIKVVVQYCDKDIGQQKRLVQWIVDTSTVPELRYSPGDKYPKGPNDTALALMRENWDGVKAVLLLEPDCVPVAPDWLERLSAEWDRASAAGKLIMGSWHPININHPTMGHLNGNLIFDARLAQKITIPDVPDQHPWDTFLAATFQPYWCRTGLIKNLNRHKTATQRQLSEPECGKVPPVLIHGVKDESVWNYAKSLCDTASSSPATEKTSSG
jgi:hypothetical protein